MRDVLFAAASPFVGPMRLQVGLDNVPPGATVYPWPLTKSPETYLVDYLSTASIRVDDPSEVDALRTLRDQALADAASAPILFPGVIVVEPPGYVRKHPDETFVMSLRDDLPFTSSDGTWSPP